MFTESQIAGALMRVELGLSAPKLCRDMGFSSATFCKWRARTAVGDDHLTSTSDSSKKKGGDYPHASKAL